MPNWRDVLVEIGGVGSAVESAQDVVRRKYLKALEEYTKRNVIAYYSGWLQKPGVMSQETGITDDDKNAFMMAIHKMDCSKGLDLILHTPGGGIAATESIIDYLHRKFYKKKTGIDIRVIIPQLAMSAGTMMACASHTIVMGKESNLGPIDPQLRGAPAYGVIHEFELAHKEIKEDPTKLSVWQFVLNKYHPSFLTECRNAIELSKELVLRNLEQVMFKGSKNAKAKAQKIVDYLAAYSDRKTHSRHINIDECRKIGLSIESLEKDQKLQDIILTIHHCYMHTLANTPAIKITENHMGAAMVRSVAMIPAA